MRHQEKDVALFKWNESYSVGVGLCDAQHQKLFAIINELSEAMRLGNGKEVISSVTRQLQQYTQTHFQQEEALLRKTNYPQLASHQQLHRKFTEDVEALAKKAGEGRANSVQTLDMLNEWLLSHIQKADKAYSTHLNAAGIH